MNLIFIKKESTFCLYDFQAYFDLGTYKVVDFQSFSWMCHDSYVISMDTSKVIEILLNIFFLTIFNDFKMLHFTHYFKPLSLTLSDISINCATNNLQIMDSNNQMFDYCQSNQPASYTFVSQSFWIRLRKSKNCFFCTAPLSFTFQTANKVVTTTTMPTTTPFIFPSKNNKHFFVN